jgi:hypothetical protein
MAAVQSSEALRRVAPLRKIFVVVTVVALGLGYLGFWQLLGEDPEVPHSPWDLFYYDLQLFVLGPDPLQDGRRASLPVTLQVARFAAPVATVSALVETARILFAVELSRWRARRSVGHVIICGDSTVADALTRRFRAAGRVVIEIRSIPDESVESGEPLRVLGDPQMPEVLADAGIDRAAAVYACSPSGAVNLAVSLAAEQSRRVTTHPAGGLEVHALIPDPDLCSGMQAMYLGRPSRADVRVDFFTIDTIAARRLMIGQPWPPVADGPPSILVAGVNGFARAVTVEAARVWRGLSLDEDRPLPVHVVGVNASGMVDALVHRYPFLDEVCTLKATNLSLITVMERGLIRQAPDWLMLCDEDEDEALRAGVTADRNWRSGPKTIVVRIDGAGAFASAPEAEAAGGTFLGGSRTVRVFAAVEAACHPEFVGEDLLDRLARVIHERYVYERRRRHETAPTDPSLVPWEHLSAHLRRMNREQAEDIAHKLEVVGRSVRPRLGPNPPDDLLAHEIDVLAKMEHTRWLEAHRRDGWRYGETKDEGLHRHPAVVQWEWLGQAYRRRSEAAVAELPHVLADAGFQIVRVDPLATGGSVG